MKDIKRILMISLDSDLYLSSFGIKVPGDPYLRHCNYQKVLKEKSSKKSEIRVIVFTNKILKNKVKHLNQDKELKIIGSNSINRIFFSIDIFLQIIKLIKQKWIPTLITTQNPWGEAIVSLIISKFIKAGYLSQIHIDISSKYWLNEKYLLNHFRILFSLLVMYTSNYIRVVSKVSARNISHKYKINLKKFIVAPVPVSLSEEKEKVIKSINKKIESDKFNILFVGRFEKQKNLSLWIESALKIASKKNNVTFNLIGYGSELNAIKNLVKSSQYKEKFNFIDKVNYENLSIHFLKNHLLLLTSFYEGFGRVILEAMNFGLPCISTASGGPEDLIINGKNGFITNFNSNKITELCLKLIENKEKYILMGENSLKLAKHKFNSNMLTDQIIDSLIKSSK